MIQRAKGQLKISKVYHNFRYWHPPQICYFQQKPNWFPLKKAYSDLTVPMCGIGGGVSQISKDLTSTGV